jgi:hypothetical protein
MTRTTMLILLTASALAGPLALSGCSDQPRPALTDASTTRAVDAIVVRTTPGGPMDSVSSDSAMASADSASAIEAQLRDARVVAEATAPVAVARSR